MNAAASEMEAGAGTFDVEAARRDFPILGERVHGKPLVFGRDRERGLRLKPGTLDIEAVVIGKDGVDEADLLVHDETNPGLAMMLASMHRKMMPIALGVLYCDPAPSYESRIMAQVEEAKSHSTNGDLNSLLRRGHTWVVKDKQAKADA